MVSLFPLSLGKIYSPAMWSLSKHQAVAVCIRLNKGPQPLSEKMFDADC